MPRTPDPNSPAAWRQVKGDCLSGLPPWLLLFVWAYHRFEDPPDTSEPIDPIPAGGA
jgi:hypothetical protein